MDRRERLTRELKGLNGPTAKAEAERNELMTALLDRPDDAELQERLDQVESELARYRRQARRIHDLLDHAERMDSEAAQREAHAERLARLAEIEVKPDEDAKDAEALQKQAEKLIETLVRMRERRQQAVGAFHRVRDRTNPRQRDMVLHGFANLENIGAGLARMLIDAGLHMALGPLEIATIPGAAGIVERAGNDEKRARDALQQLRECLEADNG